MLYPDPELTFKTKLADLPLIVQEMIFSNKIDDNGVLIRTANDKPGYFAVGFMSEKANEPALPIPAVTVNTRKGVFVSYTTDDRPAV